jgi:ACDE family multidrug resistance protein
VSTAETTKRRNRIYWDPNLRSVSSITPAFPKITEALHISPLDVGLLITVFTLPGVLLTPVLGVLADRFGRKQVVVPALFLFAVAGTACFFATDFRLLLLLRFLQGVGGASLGAINVTIIGDLFSGGELTAAMGYNSSVLSVGTAGYPAIGGALALLGWNYPFLLPAFAVPVALVVLFRLDAPQENNKQRIREYFKGAIQSLMKPNVFGLVVTGTVTFILLYGLLLTYLPFFLAQNFQTDTLIIGLVMTSTSLSSALTSAQLERLSKIVSERTLILIGLCMYLASALLIPLSMNLWFVLLPTLLFGIGNGINIPSIVSFLSRLAPRGHRAAVLSVNGMVIRLGQTLGPIIMGAVFAFWGINAVFLVGAAIAAALIIFSAALIR